MNKPISSLMERHVHCIGMDDTVAQVESLLASWNLSWAPVLESTMGTLIGVLSTADLLQFHAQGRDAHAVQAWQLCTYKPIVVSPDMSIAEVARLMVERKIHHVVVTDSQGIAGVVSSLDFVRNFVAPA